MKLKKSVLGFIMYILYGILVTAMLGLTLYVMIQKIVMSGSTKVFLEAFVLVSTVLVLFLVKLFSKQLSPKVKIPKKWKILIEMICITVIFTAVIFLRMRTAGVPISDESNYFFKTASVQTVKPDFYMENNVSMIYGYVLSFVLSLFGNREEVCTVFQFILQCLALGLLYMAIRNISGILTAVLAVFALGISPVFINAMFPIGPDMLYLCICIFTLFVISVIWRYNTQGSSHNMTNILVFLLSGILTGIVIFMDFFAVGFLVIAMVGIVLSNTETKEKASDRAWLKNIVYFAGTAIGCILLFLWKAIAFGIPMKQPFMEYIDIVNHSELVLKQLLPFNNANAAVIILITAGIWIVEYRKADRDEAILYFLLLAGSIAANMMLPDTLDYTVFLVMAWVLLAAVGIKSLVTQYCDQGIWIMVQADSALTLTEKDELQNVIAKKIGPPKQQILGEPKEIQYIANPLPVPKKHVKKEMDYAFIPEEAQMHYDLQELKENDDFEL